jgi:ElaB/YqjD/DUF883 family membrane-anchored ribosome-binding protein
MTDEDRMAENAEVAVRDAAGKASDKVRELGDRATKTFRDTADQANRKAKEGVEIARQFAENVQSSFSDMDVRKIPTRQPWITVGVTFAVGFLAGQLIRRPPR